MATGIIFDKRKGGMKWFNSKLGCEEDYHGVAGAYTYYHDFHFLHCEANYEKLISLITAAAMLTQFLGNVADISVQGMALKPRGNLTRFGTVDSGKHGHWMYHIVGAARSYADTFAGGKDHQALAGGNSLAKGTSSAPYG